MSAVTKIEWATHTWNPWEGCTKVSPGCANCYAAVRNHRFGNDNWGRGKPRRRTSKANWSKPHRWNNEDPYTDQYRARVFPSLCDWLDDEVPIEWLADFLKLIHETPNLDWLLLTKRPENFLRRIVYAKLYFQSDVNPDSGIAQWLLDWASGTSPSNVWIGVSVEDQQRADERIPQLLTIPAAIRFLSVEPLLGELRLPNRIANVVGTQVMRSGELSDWIDWVIIGGESGPKARPCNINWIYSIVEQCRSTAVACFVKQVGANVQVGGFGFPTKHTKGGDPEEWPANLRVRQFPQCNRS